MHGLKALKSGYRDDEELTGKNVEVAFVGADGFTKYGEEQINDLLNKADEVFFLCLTTNSLPQRIRCWLNK
jgi:20S proteasome alpha/beta subunit